MNNKKWLAPILPYLAVWAGLFLFKSAWFALIGFHISMLFVLIIARPNIPTNILFKSKSLKWSLISILLCGSSGLGLTSSSWFVFIAYFSLVNLFIEEYFWRAYLGSRTKGFYIGDLVYAGYHGLVLMNKVYLISILFAVASLTFIGWLWRQMFREDE